jgi:ApaG protein
MSNNSEARRSGPFYERITQGIRVAVKPAYLEDQSEPDEGKYLWSYTITIENRGQETVQLMSRYWHITDAAGRVQEVRGPGVVGAQPVLEPGQSFEYTSGCPLPTASGTMAGRYQMKKMAGDQFEAEIPPFLLETPHERRQVH